jgi:vacuolar-type H+-ATPase subunit E/Vma4
MEAQAEKIELLERAILDEARTEGDSVRAEAQARADAILQRAREQAQAESKAILDRAAREAERLQGQAVATAQLKSRSQQLEHREKLLDKVFQAAGEKLAAIPKRSGYEQVAARLLADALAQLRVEKAVVRADAATQKILKDSVMKKVAGETNVELTAGETLAEGTGLVVEASNGHLQFDNTFETRLSRMRNSLRSSVYQVLMGEKL